MDMAFDEVFADGKRIGLRALGWPANPSQSRVAFQQPIAAFKKMFPTGALSGSEHDRRYEVKRAPHLHNSSMSISLRWRSQ